MYRHVRPAVRSLLLLALVLSAVLPVAAQASTCAEGVDHIARAESALAEGQYVAAINSYSCAIELNPDDDSARLGRATAMILNAAQRGDIDFNLNDDLGVVYERSYELITAAIADASAAITEDPTDIDALSVRGFLYWYIGQNQNALADFDAILRADRENAYAYFYRGAANLYLGNDAKAVTDFDLAIANASEPAGAYAQVGGMYANIGDYRRAIVFYDEAIERAPDNADFYSWRAYIYSEMGDLEAAIADYTQAIELAPDDTNNYLNRAYMYEQLGDYAAAVDDYGSVIAIDPTNATAYEWRGWAYIELGENTLAVEQFDEAIALDPEARWSYLGRGTALGHLGQMRESARDFELYVAFTESYRTDAETMKPGRSQTLELSEGQVYVVPLNAEAGTGIEIQATARDNSLDPMFVLLDVDGDPLAGSDDITPGNLNSGVSIPSLPDSGRYTLLVTHAGGGSYGRLDVDIIQTTTDTPLVPTPVPTPVVAAACGEGLDEVALARVAINAGDYATAVTLLECALDDTPDDAALLLQRGLAGLAQGPELAAYEAISDANRLDDTLLSAEIDNLTARLDADPTDLYALSGRAFLYWFYAMDEDALPDYEAILALDPDNVLALLLRGSSNQYLGNGEAAAEDFERVSQLAGDNLAVLDTISRTLYDTGEYERALETLDRAVTLDSDNTGWLTLRANTYYQLGDLDAAVADLNVAVGLSPDDGGLHEELGWMLLRSDRPEDAAAAFEEALKLDPTLLYSMLGMATAQTDLGDVAEGARGFAQYIEAIKLTTETATLTGAGAERSATLLIEDGLVFRIPLVLSAGQAIDVDVRALDVEVDPLALLESPSGEPLVGSDDPDLAAGDFDPLILNFVAPESGTYTLVVTHSGGGNTGEVEVIVRDLTAEPPALPTLPPKNN